MKHLLLTVALCLMMATVAGATSYTATHEGSSANYRSWLQYGDDNRRVSFFTNRMYVGVPVTHDVSGLTGDFSVFVQETQKRYALDDRAFRRVGDTYYFEDMIDRRLPVHDFNDFVFTIDEDIFLAPEAPVTQTPEPGSLALLLTGLAGLWYARYRRTP